MQIETEIEVKFRTTLGDYFDGKISKKDRDELIEQHIEEYCEEHDIEVANVRIIR